MPTLDELTYRHCSIPGCTYREWRGEREGDFVEGKFMCPTHAVISAAENQRNAAYIDRRPVINRRELRTRQLLAHMLQVLRPYLIRDSAGDAARVLTDFLYVQGAEIITEADRIKAGLAPRDHNGLTLQELQIIEARLLTAQMAPPMMVVSSAIEAEDLRMPGYVTSAPGYAISPAKCPRCGFLGEPAERKEKT